ncbi:MAG: class I SAM-dependent DNA methyltransferase [Pyrinomonadaceae bacterium]|nr:class I SAM-dependent DNA methyltransferase [Pyrinomonadaceae bacterium]
MSPQEFVAKWSNVALTERASSQPHFEDLCRLLDQPTPTDADPTGDFYTFEKGATKAAGLTKGKRGWADVWKKGYFAWEYKGPHANLDKAYQQLQQYRESLENPPLSVVSDIQTIQVHTNFTNSVKQVTTFTLDDLLIPEKLDQLRRVWTNPSAFRVAETPEQVTERAAQEFARLAELLRDKGEDPDKAAHFLIRLLFCLFVEDVRLLPEKLFGKLVAATRTKPEAFTSQLRQLFGAMSTGGFFGVDQILHFNGGLFDDDEVLELDAEGLRVLNRLTGLDWGSVEPAILGTLFERSLDPNKRAQLGAHYTSREDILAIVEPVLMVPLRRRWTEMQEQARSLVERRDASSGGQRTQRHNELARLLTSFVEEIAAVRVLDPACGSGNFLYVALKQLLDLEKGVIAFAREVDVPTFFPKVGPEQVHGIELNEYAHDLATATVWIGYIQWLRDNGFGRPTEPILKPLESVTQMDAVLAYDELGNPVEPDWPEADVIVGNPPFLGIRKMREEMDSDYVEGLRGLYAGTLPSSVDLVCYFFEKSRALIESGKAQRAGLLATNSIRGGKNRTVLTRINESGNIFFAESDRPWILNGAAVRVSMVGFDDGTEKEFVLDGVLAAEINADLTGTLDLSSAARLKENAGVSFQGTAQAGPFEIDEQTAKAMLSSVGNPNGRPNSDVIKRSINGIDITRRSRNVWTVDFGTNMPAEDAALYEVPFEYVRANVKPQRANVREKNYREKWWLFARPRPEMRRAFAPLSRYIATPWVSKHRVYVWMPTSVIPSLIGVFAREDDYFFGVLHSRAHELWARRLGTYMGAGNDLRYTPTTCFETFPLPWPPGEEPAGDLRIEAIAEAARRLDKLRRNWLDPDGASEAELKKRTLTKLYNARPAWLQNAHERLDEAVFAAYGWPEDIADEDILKNLLALNLERSEGQGS